MMKSLIFILAILAGANTWACDPSCAEHQSFFSQLNLLQQVAIVGEENREMFVPYAKKRHLTDEEMHIKASGTGEFHCGGFRGGANLVSKNGCLALDSHAFFVEDESGKCAGWLNREQLAKCYFQAIDAKGKPTGDRLYVNPKTLRITAGKNHCVSHDNVGNDWAVIQLKFDVPDSVAHPYDIFDFSKLGPMVNNKVASVNYKKPMYVSVVSTGATNYPDPLAPTICDGEVGYIGIPEDQTELLQTDSCSGGKGVTVQESRTQTPQLFAITTSTTDSNYNGVPYGDDNYSAGVLIHGAFLRTINECKKTPAINK